MASIPFTFDYNVGWSERNIFSLYFYEHRDKRRTQFDDNSYLFVQNYSQNKRTEICPQPARFRFYALKKYPTKTLPEL